MKTDLSDKLTILIAAKADSEDRLTNLGITLDYLKHHFDMSIVLSEQDDTPKLDKICKSYGVKHVFYETIEFFNRQRGVNICARNANTPVIAHYDADILLKPQQIKAAVKAIIEGSADLVYPYDGHFYDVPTKYHKEIVETKNLNCVDLEQCTLFNPHSVGGVVIFNKDHYWKCGGANENFKGLGYEDNEINERFKKLNSRIVRTQWPLYHLTHERKDTSFNHNPHLELNKEEYFRIANMSNDILQEEVNSWSWVK
jgi:predicted glycosyltransferase involved in capsule biosynthesis